MQGSGARLRTIPVSVRNCGGYLLDPSLYAAEPRGGTATIMGSVVSDAGSLAAAQVKAYRIGAKDGQPVLVEACDTTTNSKGAYRCENLQAGDYFLAVVPSVEQSELGLPSFTIYPQTADIDRAIATHLGETDIQQLDVRIPAVKGSRIDGTTEGPAEHLEVSLAEQGEFGYEFRVR